MLDFLLDVASERKFRLFAIACVRRHLDLLEEYKWAGKAVDAAEWFVEGRLTQAQMSRAASVFDAASEEEDLDDPADGVSTALWHLMNACKPIDGAAWAKSKAAAGCLAVAAAQRKQVAGSRRWKADLLAEQEAQCGLLRCIIDPYRADALTPSATVARLAQAAAAERLPGGEMDPLRLAVLADALEEDGVTSGLMLHLREPGTHVRGCRSVDACLGRS